MLSGDDPLATVRRLGFLRGVFLPDHLESTDKGRVYDLKIWLLSCWSGELTGAKGPNVTAITSIVSCCITVKNGLVPVYTGCSWNCPLKWVLFCWHQCFPKALFLMLHPQRSSDTLLHYCNDLATTCTASNHYYPTAVTMLQLILTISVCLLGV